MVRLDDVMHEAIKRESLIYAVLSNVKKGVEKTFHKLDIKPVLIKGQKMYHFSFYYENKVMHENLDGHKAIERMASLMGPYFKQGVFYCENKDYQILFSKKGDCKVIEKAATRKLENIAHNRQKQYIIPEGVPCDLMMHLGIMDVSGKVYAKKYDKFRQLNKYLEFVEDSLPELERSRRIRIIDFGCGKAYLTFALYYYFANVCGLDVEITGLDLKEDVIAFCNQTAKVLGYEKLRFELGDIKDYHASDRVDMVVSLHACDTATDEALIKAVAWGAKVIFAVPCCQHELFRQINHESMAPLLKHGVVKDKLTTLVTDALRALALEGKGYDVQVLEFIDMTHTPKNVLIRAYKRMKSDEENVASVAKYEAFKKTWSVSPRIDGLFK